MANVIIDIAAEFTGKKAFKQAESSTDKLIKGVKKLAGATGLAFGTAQVIAYGKASVKAALEAQAQQERLASLLKVTVGARDSEIQALNEQADALERIGVVNKDNITQVQSQLATFNLQVSTIKALTPAVLDYVTAEKGAAASTDEFKSMTNGLAQALNGNFASLTKTGFVLDEATKNTIKNGTESERTAAIIAVLDSTYKDFNKNLGETDSGKMAKLANAAEDVKEIIGKGIIDSLKSLSKDGSVESLANNMRDVAFYVADVIRGIGVLIRKIGDIPILGDALKFLFTSSPLLDYLANLGKIAGVQKAADNQHLKSLEQQFVVIRKTGDTTKKLTAEELKKLKAKQLQLAIDKANLALNKGQDVFDMDKIQIAAALTNQAEQLGKATTSSQILQIANDVARLNVKKSILALEDAIAAKDEQAIIKATEKLNADLKVLGALTGQKVTLTSIESILSSLKPKDLINQDNLDEALRKIKEMLGLLAQANSQATAKVPTSATLGSGIPVNDYIAPISKEIAAQGSIAAILEYADAAAARANAFADLLDMDTAAKTQALQTSSLYDNSGALQSFRQSESAASGNTIIVNTGIGDPNAIAEAIDQVLIEAMQRGTLRGGLYAV